MATVWFVIFSKQLYFSYAWRFGHVGMAYLSIFWLKFVPVYSWDVDIILLHVQYKTKSFLEILNRVWLIPIPRCTALRVPVCLCVCVLYSDSSKLSALGCGHVFTGHVTRWLNVLRHVVLQRVHRAVQLDTVSVIVSLLPLPRRLCNVLRLSVCLLATVPKNTERIFTNILPQMYLCTRKNWSNFESHPPPDLDPGIFWRILQHCKMWGIFPQFGLYLLRAWSDLHENTYPLNKEVHVKF